MPEKSRDLNSNLPTNVEQATPEYVEQHLDAWERKIIAATTDASQPPDKPLFLLHAEQQAQAEGCSLEAVLNRYSSQLRNTTYPSPQCLRPAEVRCFEESSAPFDSARLDHVEKCNACKMILSALAPRDWGELFVKVLSHDQPVAAELEESSIWAFAVHRGLAIFLPIVALFLAFLLAWVVDPRAARLTAPSSPITWGIVAVATIIYLFALRDLKKYIQFRTWITAAIVGCAFSGIFWVDFHQSRLGAARANEAELKLAQSRTELLVSSALEQKEATGRFLTPAQASAIIKDPEEGPGEDKDIQVKTEALSPSKVTYIVTLPKVPSVIRADVEAGSADITYEGTDQVLSRISYLLKTVKSVQPIDKNTAKITFEDGRSYTIPTEEKSLPAPGSLVAATVNRKTSSLNNFRVVSFQDPIAKALSPF